MNTSGVLVNTPPWGVHETSWPGALRVCERSIHRLESRVSTDPGELPMGSGESSEQLFPESVARVCFAFLVFR